MDGAAGLCLAFGLTTLGAYLIINYLPFDSFSIAWDRRQVVYLAIYFRAATVPFLCSGLLVGSRLVTAGHANGCAHFVYAANLIGSAFGCVASLPALTVVLFTLLLFSGLGSLTVNRWRLVVGLAGLVLLVGLYPVVLQLFSTLALRSPEWERTVLSVLVLAPAGYLMGLPFAGGVHVLEHHDSSLIPWAWAINGSVSVVSAVLAVMLALSWGFTAVLWLGILAYAGALAAFWRYAERDDTAA